MLKVKYIGEDVIGGLTQGNVYKVEKIVDTLFEIIDDDGDHSLWEPESFEIVEGSIEDVDEVETVD